MMMVQGRHIIIIIIMSFKQLNELDRFFLGKLAQ